MGFGTLFVGYFLLLNLTYYGFTDLIAGLVMLMAFYKLTSVNKRFAYATYAAGLFSLIGALELYNEVVRMFLRGASTISFVSPALRHLSIGIFTVFMLLGICEVASEVGLKELARRCKITMPFSALIFLVALMLEIPSIDSVFTVKVLGIASVLLLLVYFVVVIVNLISIYTAYMRICMPEDVDNEPKNKPSRFGFVNKFRAHEEEKQREYAEYQLEKFKKKHTKKKK